MRKPNRTSMIPRKETVLTLPNGLQFKQLEPDISKMREVKIDDRTIIFVPMQITDEEAKHNYSFKLRNRKTY